jgi:hypothetical protein
MPVCANFSMAITINVISTKLLEYTIGFIFFVSTAQAQSTKW